MRTGTKHEAYPQTTSRSVQVFVVVVPIRPIRRVGPVGGTIMQNVKFDIKGDTLTITVDLKQRQGKSASGKTTVIATTQGNTSLNHPSGAVVGLNVYTKGE